ncbi:energy transducer TonB [Sphingobium boeckii]|uniref:Protein TonB n=1 Tax=Sphingobium boeckii TaxID=1082345 RepID=A0A7W9AGF5_9SPHN|nr:energy transducer TonB [Sphingobium boeckii]MBB5685155.1 protein TonB [Sphingobium boeckii]
MRLPIRIGAPAAASLLVNGLMVAALLNLGIGGMTSHKPPRAIAVMDLAVLKGAEDGVEEAQSANEPAGEPSPTPPAAAPTAVAAIVPPPPMPVPGARAAPSLPLAAQSTAPAAPAATSPAKAAPSIAAASASASASASEVRKGARDGLDANAPSGTSRSYAARVRSWLLAHKTYPRRAKMRREEGVVRVFFVIDRGGRLMEGWVTAGSGFLSLDEEAAAMLRRASPYPSAPSEVRGDRIEISAPVEFTLPL